MDIKGFLTEQQLPDSYQHIAQQWFIPLAEEIAAHQNGARQPFFVGVNGCQGSGKSTVCAFLVYYFSRCGLDAVTVSLDDFYLSQQQRQSLAQAIHPLFATRGVPGTHDTALAAQTFRALKQGESVALPRFNKSTDNPFDQQAWPVVLQTPDIVLVEGWCWGVAPQTEDALLAPVNKLEADEDSNGRWRRYVNEQLANTYQPLFDEMDYWFMLKGPSFDCVYQWRCEQEHKLATQTCHNGKGLMSDEQILRFIQHYQRLTEHAFRTLPKRCNRVFELDEHRNIFNVIRTSE
ncbi:kinase [Aestuariibacter sp. A3R04]|uniref:kinase n=1 Tax=Aestuariibacter sp. A3R04 TaxID=2841571 RepID=UPI001C0941F7|nr:kinase [Aestuariibacter sp. A3R04]MBU3022783.1 kinase [Aestuariibacter sp. A3R04]